MKCDRWDEARGRQDEDEGFRVTVNIGRSETTEETEEGHKGGHTECRVCVGGGAFLWETWWEHWSQVFIKSHNPSLSSVPPRGSDVSLWSMKDASWPCQRTELHPPDDRSTSCSYNTLNALLLLCSISTARPAFRILLKLNVLFISRWTHWTTLSTVN